MSEEQNTRVKDIFRKKRLYQIIAAIPVILAMILMFIVSENPELFAGGPIPVNALYAAVITVVFCALVFSIFNWRCPNCNKYLGKAINPRYCSKCGIELQ